MSFARVLLCDDDNRWMHLCLREREKAITSVYDIREYNKTAERDCVGEIFCGDLMSVTPICTGKELYPRL